jgi:hypothetical protein
LNINFVALPFWASALFSACACVLSYAIYEGSGHEIILEGDEDLEETKPEVAQNDDVEVGGSNKQAALTQAGLGNRS